MAARSRRDEELGADPQRRRDARRLAGRARRPARRSCRRRTSLLLSNIHEPMPGGSPSRRARGLVFIGGFQHPPNTDGVLWYAREVLPLHPRSDCLAWSPISSGSKVPSTIRSLAAADFVVTGYVADVAPFFTGCRVSIAPLRYGAGVKGKVNLAMSYGLPVVATSAPSRAMHLESGRGRAGRERCGRLRRGRRAALSRRDAVEPDRGEWHRQHAAALLARRSPRRAQGAVHAGRRSPSSPGGDALAATKTISKTAWPSARPRFSNFV